MAAQEAVKEKTLASAIRADYCNDRNCSLYGEYILNGLFGNQELPVLIDVDEKDGIYGLILALRSNNMLRSGQVDFLLFVGLIHEKIINSSEEDIDVIVELGSADRALLVLDVGQALMAYG